jgi:membrane associated rhomboid family serine protease
MATNDFYNHSSSRPQQQQAQPYNYGRRAESPAPSYTTYAQNKKASPFEAPFDDHVYPVRPQDSLYSLGQQSTNYNQGGGGRPQPSTENSFRDDIPLRDHAKHNGATDHVYDAGEAGIPPRASDGRQGPKSRRGFGWFKKDGRIPWVVYVLTIIQLSVFIAEIVKNGKTPVLMTTKLSDPIVAQLTGSPIMINPSFNPMIGPSTQVLINMGARYVPCMHNVTVVQDPVNPILYWPCPNTTTSDSQNPSNHCTLSDLCGFGGVPNPGVPNGGAEPNQWFRFILPIFLHAGLVHIAFNMLLQLTLGREMESSIGSIRFFLVYMSAGIFGFVMGGNFAATGIASTGASGSLFGVIALTLLELLYTWGERRKPWIDLAWIGLDVVISFVLGLLPGLDNFSHIGGFLMGLVLGVCILHSPNSLRRRISEDEPPYTPVASKPNGVDSGVTSFIKSPVGFFKGRKPLWWAWWLIRAGALTAVFIVFIVLLNNFYIFRKTCGWCKYLSCLVSHANS